MTSNPEIQYTLFKYATTLVEESRNAVAAVVLSTYSDGTSDLRVHILPKWEETVEADDHLLLARDILRDWETISPTDATVAFGELRSIFNGPLRSYESGTCSARELHAILNEAFKIECRHVS